MKRLFALSAIALAACAARAQDLKPANPPLRATTPAKVNINVALPAPIVFCRTGEQKGIWKRGLDGSETRLTEGDDSQPARGSGGKILFTRKTPMGPQIWSVPVAGGNATKVVENAYAPSHWSQGLVAYLSREAGELGKVRLMAYKSSAGPKQSFPIATVGWMPRGYYFTRPVFLPGASTILVGSYEKDDGGAKPKVKVREFHLDQTYSELWSGVASSVAGIAAYKEGSTVHRLGILAPEGQSADLWTLDGGSGSARLAADPDAETSLDALPSGRLLIGAGGKLYLAGKVGTSRLPITDGYDGIWLD